MTNRCTHVATNNSDIYDYCDKCMYWDSRMLGQLFAIRRLYVDTVTVNSHCVQSMCSDTVFRVLSHSLHPQTVFRDSTIYAVTVSNY